MGHVDARVAPVCTQDGGVQAVGSRAPFSSWPSSGSRHSPATRQVWVPERRVRPDGPFSSTVAITPTTLTGDCTRSGPPVRPGMPTLRQYPSNKREPKDSGVPRDNRIISRAENQGKNPYQAGQSTLVLDGGTRPVSGYEIYFKVLPQNKFTLTVYLVRLVSLSVIGYLINSPITHRLKFVLAGSSLINLNVLLNHK